MSEVTVTLTNDNLKLIAALQKLVGVTGKVGWFASSKYPDGTQVAYVAAIHEYGAPARGITPRMGLRAMMQEKQPSWAEYAAHGAKKALDGSMTVTGAMELIGARASGDIRKQIASVQEPLLKDTTLEARARAMGLEDARFLTDTGAKPLVEPRMSKRNGNAPGGLLQGTATYVVEQDGSVVATGDVQK